MGTNANFDQKLETLFSSCYPLLATAPWIAATIYYRWFEALTPNRIFNANRVESILQELNEELDKLIALATTAQSVFTSGQFKKHSSVPIESFDMGSYFSELWDEVDLNAEIDSHSSRESHTFEEYGYPRDFFDGMRILELGCGSGRIAIPLALKTKAREVVGTDIGEYPVTKAKEFAGERKIENISFRRQDIRKLSFADNSFDFVYSIGVLHHVHNYPQALREAVRVAKSGSKVHINVIGDGGVYWNSFKKIKEAMASVPEAQAKHILQGIGLQARDTIKYLDWWYVPYQFQSRRTFQKALSSLPVSKIEFLGEVSTRPIDILAHRWKNDEGKAVYGDGLLTFQLTK